MMRHVESTRTSIRPLIDAFGPDVIWSRHSSMALGAARSAYGGRLFHVFSTTARMDSRGVYLNTAGFGLKRRLLMLSVWPLVYRTACRIERELLSRCEPICFSENVRRELRWRYGRLAERVQVIRPGVDTARFSREVGEPQLELICRRFDLDAGEPCVLFVGRLSAAKNVPLLVDALAKLDPAVRLILVGEGRDGGRIRDYVARRGLARRVVFAGEQTELLPGFYRLARVCVMPTTIESFGQTFLESMACGTPVVGFAADGRRVLTATEEIVEDGKTGRVVRGVNAKALADGIREILTLPAERYQSMSQNAVEDVQRRFRWGRFVEELLSLSSPRAAGEEDR
jgi:glycosyltransferase involved in cell wall biosynthesis